MATAAAFLLPAGAAAAVPATPTGLQVNATGPKQVALTWTRQTAPEPTENYVYRNGVLVGTTDGDAANFLDRDAALSNNTTYSYTVKAANAEGTSAASTAVSGTPVNTTPLTGCSTGPVAPGHYQLTTDITVNTTTDVAPCLQFLAGTNVSLDCGGHKITQQGTGNILRIASVNKFLVTNCVFEQLQVNVATRSVTVDGGSYGRFSNNTFQSPLSGNAYAALEFSNHPHAVVGQKGQPNTFTQANLNFGDHSDYAYAGYNSMLQGAQGPAVALYVRQTDHAVVVHNDINCGWDGLETDPLKGCDDALLPVGPVNDLKASFNLLRNTYDAAIEPVGTVTNSFFDDNTISNVRITAFGEYWSTDLVNNSFSRNQVTKAPQLLAVTFGHSDIAPLATGAYRFQNNVIDGNVFTQPILGRYGNWDSPVLVSATDSSNAHPVGAINGNVFSNNVYLPVGVQPSVTPATLDTVFTSTTSTGNVCQPVTPVAWWSCTPPVRAAVTSGTLVVSTPKKPAVNIDVTASSSTYTVTNPTGILAVSPCTQTTETKATCPGVTAAVNVVGNVGADKITVNSPLPSTLNGSGGDDLLTSKGAGADVINGGSGNDTIDYTWSGPISASADGVANDGPGTTNLDNIAADVEVIRGTAFADTFINVAGNQTYEGLNGTDTYKMGAGGTDTISDIGATGTDVANFQTGTTAGITVTPGSGANGLNVVGSGISVTSVGLDSVNATPYNDTMTANNAGVILTGGTGDDTLNGGPGNDQLVGGVGIDIFRGNGGDDVMYANDGKAENVDCGSGNDGGFYDASDVKTGCEA